MAASSSPPRQAVLLIHGIGEQFPMDTLRGFVDAVWTTDRGAQHPYAKTGLFSKPDDLSGSYELRRLSTTQSAHGVVTDFYEFYWAHLLDDTTLSHVMAWLKPLLWRRPGTLPRQLRGVWWLLWGLLALAAAFFVQSALPAPWRFLELPAWATAALGFGFTGAVVPVLNNVIGDAARYLHPAPTNVKHRQEIRARGVEILRKLHESQQYERIVVVGHSLGSVIGYDLLTHAWPEFARQSASRHYHPQLDQLETLAAQPGPLDVAAYQAQQAATLAELRANGCPWRVTDFITLGSPLTHAAALLARDEAALRTKQQQRELPTCPPTPEGSLFSYPPDRKRRQLHHAAVFGPTRWTNLYFPARWLVQGDVIGGPLAPVFGAGIRDCPVRTHRTAGLLSHTYYWLPEGANPPGAHVECLRQALRLGEAG